MATPRRRICFVTGSRAEFGLMQTTLAAIRDHPKLKLQIVATGMHLGARRAETLRVFARAGWTIDRLIPWKASPTPQARAEQTGRASAALAGAFGDLKSDVVLVVGDRVEAFAAAAAGHLCDLPVAHIHGGDRALGQADDSLRHAITKLAHVHFAATKASAARIRRLGEDSWRIHTSGAPGIDGIRSLAAPRRELVAQLGTLARERFAFLVLHPVDPDPAAEARRARQILEQTLRCGVERVIIVHPNNDPGSSGIARCWQECGDARVATYRDLPRRMFLGLLRDAAFLIGNSSSGIIEAASFGTPVIDIGPRQFGREHGENVVHAPYAPAAIGQAIAQTWRNGRPRRFPRANVYGGGNAGKLIAQMLASLRINTRLIRKLIAY